MPKPAPTSDSAAPEETGSSHPRLRRLLPPLFCLITAALLFEALFPLSRLPSARGDSGQMVWNLWHTTESILDGENPLSTLRIYHPVGAQLATHTLAAGFSPVALAVRFATGSSELYPFHAFKLIVYLCFALNLYLTFLLLNHLGFGSLEALLPALAFAFSDFFFFHISQLNLTCGFLFPLGTLLLVRAIRKPEARRVLPLALMLAFCVYFGEYFVYLLLGFGIALVVALAASSDRAGLVALARRISPGTLLCALAVFALVLAPFWISWSKAQPLPVAAEETSRFSANLAGFFLPSPASSPLYDRLPTDLFGSLDRGFTEGMGGFEIFVGYPFLLLGALGLLRPGRLERLAGSCALAFWLLSLGPTLKFLGYDTGLWMPFAALHELAPFDQSRMPVRFAVAAMFAFTIPAAAGASRLARWLKRSGRPWLHPAVMALLGTWILAEAWFPIRFLSEQPLPIEQLGLLQGEGPVFCVPVRGNLGQHVALQTLHGEEISSGYLARPERRHLELSSGLGHALRSEPHDLPQRVRALGYRSVLVTETLPFFVWQRLGELSLPIVSLAEPPYLPESLLIFGRPGGGSKATVGYGQIVSFASHRRGRYLLRQGWSTPEAWGTWSDGEEATLVFDLDEPGAVILRIGARFFEDPSVSVSFDGDELENLASGTEEAFRFHLDRAGQRHQALVFRIAKATSPRSVGLSDDDRQLGVGLEWLVLEPAPGEPTGAGP